MQFLAESVYFLCSDVFFPLILLQLVLYMRSQKSVNGPPPPYLALSYYYCHCFAIRVWDYYFLLCMRCTILRIYAY
jgi:hypothetical protein